jgi:hypothetical protein
MWSEDVEARWRKLSHEVITGTVEWRGTGTVEWRGTGTVEWRGQHPQATLRGIEAALDERLAHVRARMLQDTALASAATDISALPAEEWPCCPDCGPVLEARSQEEARYARPMIAP